MPEVYIAPVSSVYVSRTVPSEPGTPSPVPSAVVRIPRICRPPVPRVVEPWVEEDSHTPVPRVIVPAAPVPWVIITPVPSVVPRVPCPACVYNRPVVFPWGRIVIVFRERVVCDCDCSAVSAVELYYGRLVLRYYDCILLVSEKQKLCLLRFSDQLAYVFIYCLYGRSIFVPAVVYSVRIFLS